MADPLSPAPLPPAPLPPAPAGEEAGRRGPVAELFGKVVTEPLFAGLAGWRGLPPGYRPIVALGAVLAVAAVLLMGVLTAYPELAAMRMDRGILAVPWAGQVLLFSATVVLALVQTGALHAPWPLALPIWVLLGFAIALLTAQTSLSFPDPATLIGPLAWLGIGLFGLIRRRRPPRWWEFFVVWAAVLLAAYLPGLLTSAVVPGLGAPNAQLVTLLGYLFGAGALPLALLTGCVMAAVAASFCLWTVELLGRPRTGGRAPALARRGMLVVTCVAGVLVVAAAGRDLLRTTLGPRDLVATGAITLVWALAGLLVWSAVRFRADRTRAARSRADRSGAEQAARVDAPESVLGAVGRVGWPAALVLAVPTIVEIIPLTAVTTWRVQWQTAPFSAEVQTLLTAGQQYSDQIARGATAVAGLGCLAVGLLRAGRDRTGGSALLALIGISLLMQLLGQLSGLRLSSDLLAVLLVVSTLVVVVLKQVRRELSSPVVEAAAAAVLLAGAVTNVELVADPVGTALQWAGGAIGVLALFWTALTSGDLAGGESPTFPRVSRAMMILASLLVALLLATTGVLVATSPMDLDASISTGASRLGVPLLFCIVLGILYGALKGREPIEQFDHRAG